MHASRTTHALHNFAHSTSNAHIAHRQCSGGTNRISPLIEKCEDAHAIAKAVLFIKF